MKKQLFFLIGWLLFCAFTQSLFSQNEKIKYESSFEKAKSLALEKHKPLAVLITIQPMITPPTNQINWMNEETIAKKFNTNFINFKVAREDTVVSGKVMRELKINRFPSITFLDAKGGLLFSDVAALYIPQLIIDQADKAIALSKEKSLIDYESEYNDGNKDAAFLKAYILRRQRSGFTDNADLIEQYVENLSVRDLNDYAQVLFILKAGPFIDGRAYKMAVANPRLNDSIFKTEPLTDRKAINNAIIVNSMNNAIKNKNIARARATAAFTLLTWGKNYVDGYKNQQLKMIQYYRGVKDTAFYLMNASNFYDNYYMRISVDSIRKKEKMNIETIKNNALQNAAVSKNNPAMRSMSISYTLNESASELNNAALNFYQFAGYKTDYLFKALLWSRRAIELNPIAGFYDTYAHLLYKAKFFDEAESMQKKAIELSITEKKDTKIFQAELEKIKSRTL